MKEEKYRNILIMKENNQYLQWSNAENPICADCHQWIEWNKPLPDDVDSVQYKYENGELKAV